MANSYPNYMDVPSHKPLAYLQEFDCLAQFGNPSADDRSNCRSNEFRGTHTVAPKSK
jgi:hypothetical protein